MYLTFLLIGRYFQRKLIAMFALLAVMLCTAMVIIVISVMGGFLDHMMHTAQKLGGDVVVLRDLHGFPHHKSVVEALVELDEVAAAAPLVRGYGLLKQHGMTRGVNIVGIEPASFDTVTEYRAALHWDSQDFVDYIDRRIVADAPRGDARWETARAWFAAHDVLDQTMAFRLPTRSNQFPGIVPGIVINPYNNRDEDGQYAMTRYSTGSVATLTVLPITSEGGTLNPAVEQFTIVNEFKSGFMEMDANVVYIPFGVLQTMLGMESFVAYDDNDEPVGTEPARATEILVRGAEEVPLADLRDVVHRCVDRITRDREMKPLFVRTWLEDRFGTLIQAVQKEKMMMAFLFGVISLVAVVMIAVIFYMIVMDKTRDIGVLRAIGASRLGIMAIFLGYALAIGIAGASAGLALAAAVVLHLNEIQDLLARTFDFKMWDPKIYYFDRIPGRLDAWEVLVIMLCAVIASVLGALIPAWLAGRTDPVTSLRYE